MVIDDVGHTGHHKKHKNTMSRGLKKVLLKKVVVQQAKRESTCLSKKA